MSLDLTNGQKCPASFDLFDQKGKAISPLPEGTTVLVTGGDTGGPSGVAQWVDGPELGQGTITTEGDNVGTVTLSATMTLADGKSFTGSLVVNVKNSAPGTAAFTAGTPVDE
jgi:hypothetical protein